MYIVRERMKKICTAYCFERTRVMIIQDISKITMLVKNSFDLSFSLSWWIYGGFSGRLSYQLKVQFNTGLFPHVANQQKE